MTRPARPYVETVIVRVQCPGCGYRFIAGHIVIGAWWAVGLTPAAVAARPFCERCSHRPPMIVRSPRPLPLFDGARR